MSGDSVRVASPLFPVEGQGSIPMSPLQFEIKVIPKLLAKNLNGIWHSRLPLIPNWQNCECYGALYKNVYFAIAMWSIPSARMLNGRGWWELRRMAIHINAPKNTASRMLKIMAIMIKKDKPNINKLISYQDTDVHSGTIYKASGWVIGNVGNRIDENKKYNNWKTRPGRSNQSLAPKIRWEKQIRPEPEAIIKPPKKPPQKGLFF